MYSNRKGYSNLRAGRTSIIGHVYHITFSTLHRQPIFSNFQLARTIIQAMMNSDVSKATHTYAYVVMPDHIHWLLTLETDSLSKIVSKTKSEFSRKTGLKVWNQGFYDHGIRSDEKLLTVARYIAANPLRAGLVDRLKDYPHWDAVWL